MSRNEDDPLAAARERLAELTRERLRKPRMLTDEERQALLDKEEEIDEVLGEEDPIFDPRIKGLKPEWVDEESGFRKGPARIWED